MNTYTEKLEKLVSRAKTGKSAKNEAVSLIKKAFLENGNDDYTSVVKWLMKFHYRVCDVFFENYNLTDEGAEKITSALLEGGYSKANGNTFRTRGLQICGHFLKKNIDKAIIAKLALSLITSAKQKNNSFSDGFISEFKKYIIDTKQYESFRLLCDELDNSIKKDRMKAFLVAVDKYQNQHKEVQNNTENTSEELKHVEQKTEKTTTPKISTLKTTVAAQSDNREKTLLEQLNKTNQSLAEQVEKLVSVNNIVATLKAATDANRVLISAKDAEISRLKEELEKEKLHTSALCLEKSELTEKLNSQIAKIEDLEERLRSAMKMDGINKNQELESLKTQMSNTLKYEYIDFCSTEFVCTQDNFEAIYASLDRIFKILKRFDINLK
ncbi:MAG: hypothetical protein U0L18_05225 [Acutalibacteraceae bacterium]|nr:hypothetical protein [Acutalibacteraceae bacterium]